VKAKSADKSCVNKKILIVDDDPVIRVLIEEYLTNQGYDVRVVADGIECLSEIPGFDPDLVVLDLIMPRMNGVEVLKNLRSNPDTSRLPVLMLSANTDTEAVTDSHHVNANRYLQKPFNLREVLDAVESLSPDRKTTSS
jgi:DNA-binding response OmpR family regulator